MAKKFSFNIKKFSFHGNDTKSKTKALITYLSYGTGIPIKEIMEDKKNKSIAIDDCMLQLK